MPLPPDQTDLVATNEALAKQATDLTAEVKSIKALLEEANTKNKTLTDQLGTVTTERDQLKAKDNDFNKAVAAEVARLGISSKAQDKPKEDSRPLTATEKCQAAKGK